MQADHKHRKHHGQRQHQTDAAHHRLGLAQFLGGSFFGSDHSMLPILRPDGPPAPEYGYSTLWVRADPFAMTRPVRETLNGLAVPLKPSVMLPFPYRLMELSTH